jgi:hypothetical protein
MRIGLRGRLAKVSEICCILLPLSRSVLDGRFLPVCRTVLMSLEVLFLAKAMYVDVCVLESISSNAGRYYKAI